MRLQRLVLRHMLSQYCFDKLEELRWKQFEIERGGVTDPPDAPVMRVSLPTKGLLSIIPESFLSRVEVQKDLGSLKKESYKLGSSSVLLFGTKKSFYNSRALS